MKYEVWYIPTPAGIKSFKWAPKLIDTFDDKEDADMCRHLEDADEPAPDKYEYCNWYVIPIDKDKVFLGVKKEEVFGVLPEVDDARLLRACDPIKNEKQFQVFANIECPNCECSIRIETTKDA